MPYNPFSEITFGGTTGQRRSPFQQGFQEVNPFEGLRLPTPEPVEEPSLQQNLARSYQRKRGPASSAYEQWLNNAPDREDYKPGTLDRIGAILSGGAAGWQRPGMGHVVADDILSSKYRRAQEDWSTKGSGLKDAYGLELDENRLDREERNFVLQQIKELNDQENTERDNIRQDRAALIAEQTALLNQQKLRNDLMSDGQIVEDRNDGWTYKIKPDGSVEKLWKTGRSVEEVQRDIEERDLRLANLQDRNNARSSDRSLNNQATLKEIPSLTDKDKPSLISPSQQRIARKDAAIKLLNSPQWGNLKRDGHIEFGEDGELIYNRKKSRNNPDSEKVFEEFEAALQKEIDKILNTKTGSRFIREQ